MSDIEYTNEDREAPLVVERYIYVLVESEQLTFKVLDSFYNKLDAEDRRRALRANDYNRKGGIIGNYTIHESRLFK